MEILFKKKINFKVEAQPIKACLKYLKQLYVKTLSLF